MGDRLATIDMGRKLGGGLCPFGGGAGSHLTQRGLGRGWAEKWWGGLCPFLGGSWVPI